MSHYTLTNRALNRHWSDLVHVIVISIYFLVSLRLNLHTHVQVVCLTLSSLQYNLSIPKVCNIYCQILAMLKQQ